MPMTAVRREMVPSAVRAFVQHMVLCAVVSRGVARGVSNLRRPVGTPAGARTLGFWNQHVPAVGKNPVLENDVHGGCLRFCSLMKPEACAIRPAQRRGLLKAAEVCRDGSSHA